MAFKVFLSYSWANSAERSAIVQRIERINGVAVLVDRNAIRPGDPVHPRISKMLEAADCVVVLLTHKALESHEVRDEVVRAHAAGKLIIPVIEKGTPLERLPWFARDLHWITYDERNFDDVLASIVSTIEHYANPLAAIDASEIPKRLQNLLADGATFVDVPGGRDTGEHLICELRMRQSSAIIVFRVSATTRIGDAAIFLVRRLLPHLEPLDYEWTFLHEKREIPADFTFVVAGVKHGDTVHLVGNHRRPTWMPSPASR